MSDERRIWDFVSALRERGFVVQQGALRYIDILKLCSEGKVDSCLGNHAGAPYASYFLPPSPGQDPSPGEVPPVGYDPADPNNYPANISYIEPGVNFKLRPDEAIVMIGLTPPPACYFGFRSYVGFVQNKPEKDYSHVFTIGDAYTGVYHRVWGSLGDTLNNFNIWTANTPGGAAGDPFSSSTAIITTADRGINRQVRDALSASGFGQDIVNDDNIPPSLVNMGLEKGNDTFLFIMRAAVWVDPSLGAEYLTNLQRLVKVFRITPRTALACPDPWPVPTLKIKETGISEFQVVADVVHGLDYLREEIISRFGSSRYNYVDLTPDNWLEGYEGIALDTDLMADNRDATYVKTGDFQLATDDDFVVIYGVNHGQTGKATFCNASFYGKDLRNGVALASVSIEFPNSAIEFFPGGYEDAKHYYVCKFARKIDPGRYVIIVPYSTGNPNGKAYGVDNCKDVLIGFRSYVDPVAKAGPALFEIVWDRAILFTKRRQPWGRWTKRATAVE
jgi:hypothetical protein